MPAIIHQYKVTQEFRKKLNDALDADAVLSAGVADGWDAEQIAFEAREQDTFQGGVIAHCIFGQLHIKLLFVAPEFRKQGVGKKLMESALEYGRGKGATFAYLETFSYQAPEFYTKLGFELEFSRPGYVGGNSLLYFRKGL